MSRRARRVTVTWMYGGIRATDDGSARHAWIDEDGTELLFEEAGRAWLFLGGRYAVEVSEQGGWLVMDTSPVWTGTRAGEAVRAQLLARHIAGRRQVLTLRAGCISSVMDDSTSRIYGAGPLAITVLLLPARLLSLRCAARCRRLRRRARRDQHDRGKPTGGVSC